jgi:hypothetical protein
MTARKINKAPNASSLISSVILPASFRKYFWDCPFDGLSMEKHSRFIAARILNFGDWEAITWLFARGGWPLIRRTVRNWRDLNAKTINFWNLMLHG